MIVEKINCLIECVVIDLDYITNEVIKTNNDKYIYLFARNIKGADIEKIAIAIVKIKNKAFIEMIDKCFNVKYFDKLLYRNNIKVIKENSIAFAKIFVEDEKDLHKTRKKVKDNN